MNKKNGKFYFSLIVILSALSLLWLTAHLFESYPWLGQYPQRDPDSVLFARLLEQSILRGEVIGKDNYGCFPYEVELRFSPFYRHFLFHAANIFFTLFPDSGFDPISVVGFLPIVVTWLTALLVVFTFFRIAQNRNLALLIAFCSLPGLTASSLCFFMKLDYDFLISFFIWSWICASAVFLASPSGTAKIAAGIIAALFLPTWLGSPLFFFFATALGWFLWLGRLPESEAYNEFTSSGMLIGGFVNIVHLLSSGGEHSLTLSLADYSFFQPLCLVFGGFFLFILNYMRGWKYSHYYNVVALGLFLLVIGVLFKESILQSSGLLMKKDPIHQTIGELTALIDSGNIKAGLVLPALAAFFNWPAALLPLFLFLSPAGLRSDHGRLFRFWVFLMLVLAVYQVRFLRWIGAGGGILPAMVGYSLWTMIRNSLRGDGQKNLKSAVVFLPFLIVLSHNNFYNIRSDGVLTNPQIQTYNWISRNTPPTSGYSDDKVPEYSILAHWDQGNLLAYYTRRPVVANNAMWGYKTMADIFSTTSEAEAWRLCEEKGVRYIFLNTTKQIEGSLCDFWLAFKDKPEKPEYQLSYVDIQRVSSKEYRNWFYFWLQDNLALTPRGKFGASTGFRMVYAAKSVAEVLSPFFLFERVKGASLQVMTDPGSKLVISLELKAAKMDLAYKDTKIAGPDGKITLTLPYANDYHNGNISIDPFYKLDFQKNGRKLRAKLVVNDQAVVAGQTLGESDLEFVD